MKLLTVALAALGAATAAAFELHPEYPRSIEDFRVKHPYAPRKRDCSRKIVRIRSSANATDDISDDFLQGIKDANNGGLLVLPKDKLFVIGKPLDLTFLNNIHIRLDGEIRFTDDVPYWQANAFKHPFQTNLLFWKWGGKDIKIYGTGVINGQGQRWWNEFSELGIPADNGGVYSRPILFYTYNATNLAMEGIHLKDSPIWNQLIEHSKHISYKDVICTALSNNEVLPKNTDFFDSLNVEHVSVERVWVSIGDDCFSPKTNATDLYVNQVYCNGTHGQSMGSIGQYPGEKSIIQDVVIENIWLTNGNLGARLKSWAGPNVGYGYINNITFRNFWFGAVDQVANIDQCYFNINETTCRDYPSRVDLTNVLFENFSGYTSGKAGGVLATMKCSTSPDAVCENIVFRNITAKSPCGDGDMVIVCDGMDVGSEYPCYNSSAPEVAAAKKRTCTVPQAELPSLPWTR